MIASSGYQATFLVFGLIQGAAVVVVALLLREPRRVRPVRTTSLSL